MKTTTAPLDAVIVGCGGFARNYLPVYRSLPGVRVVGCVDADLEAARSMAAMLGARHFYQDIADAVRIPADFAVISTPNFLHLDQASALWRSGKHVLLQKPMTRNLAEARELLALQRTVPDRRLGIYMSMLDFGLWWRLRDAFARESPLGTVVQVSMRLGHTGGLAWNNQINVLWRFSREKTGGGAFIMLGVHYIHFLRWLLGRRITRVVVQAKNLHCGRIEGEDVCVVQGELDNGGLVELSVAWNSQGEHLAVYGTRGSLVYLDNELLRIHGAQPWQLDGLRYDQPGKWQTFPSVVPPPLDDAGNPHNQHRAFVEALRSGQSPVVPAEEGVWDLQVTDAVYRSAASGQWESIAYD
jgi:predicted dehydrogenase